MKVSDLAVTAPDSEFSWFTTHFGHWSVVILAVMSILLLVTRVIEGSEKIAKYVPVIGRKLRDRGRRKEEASAERVAEKVMERIEPPDVASRVEALEGRIDILEQRDDVAHAWLVFDGQWHFEDEMERVENGRPIKPRLTFRQFAAKYYAGERYLNGKWYDLEDQA